MLPSKEELEFRELESTLRSYRETIEQQLAQLPKDLSPDEIEVEPESQFRAVIRSLQPDGLSP